MKKLTAILMALVLMLGSVSFAEEVQQFTLSISVLDAANAPIAGAALKIIAADETVTEAEADAEGKYEIQLNEGIYIVRATDPADGWCEQVTLGVYEDTAQEFVIRKLVEGSSVTVATFSKPNGNFSLPCFSANTSDYDVRAMLHGYSTVVVADDSVYTVNPTAVTVMSISTADKGSKTYTFTLASDLTYNDGTPITAADYVFSVLLQSGPQLLEAGVTSAQYEQLVGFANYNKGKSSEFSGVRLIDDNTFSLTISGDALPYYYELMYVNVTPYPIKAIAPGCTVADDGKGAYVTGMTAEMLQANLIAPGAYNENPTVTSGPYELTGWDSETGTVTFRANRAFKGEYDGKRPVIDLVTLKTTTADQAIAMLENGEADIINKVTDANIVTEGSQLVQNGAFTSTSYLRNGLGQMAFACEDKGPTSSQEIRQAVSSALDHEALVNEFCSGNGMPVYSYYGLGLWVATQYVNDMQDLVTTYPVDLDKAAKLIDRAGYNKNSSGKKYQEGDGIRYKKLSAKEVKAYNKESVHIVEAIKVGKDLLMPLQLTVAVSEGSALGAIFRENLTENLTALGFDFSTREMPFDQLLTEYYRISPRTCNAYLLATNFDFVFDPYYSFSAEEKYQGRINTTGIDSEILRKDALSLRSTEPGDTETYAARWLKLVQHYSEILPSIPLYSGMYFDFFSEKVQNYEPNALWSWTPAIIHSWIAAE